MPVTAVLGKAALGAATVEIAYDPGVLEADACRAEPADAFDLTMCSVDPTTSRVVLTVISARGVFGDRILAEITYQVVGGVEGNSPLRLGADPFVDPVGQPMDARLEVSRVCILGKVDP